MFAESLSRDEDTFNMKFYCKISVRNLKAGFIHPFLLDKQVRQRLWFSMQGHRDTLGVGGFYTIFST